MFNFSLSLKTKLLLFALVLVSSLALLTKVTRSEDFTATCGNSGCVSPVIAIFNESSILPGQSFEKSMAVENNRDNQINVKLSAGKKSETDDLFLNVLTVSIKNQDDSLISTSSLADFLNGTKLDLGNIAVGARKSIKIAIDFDKNAGNAYQAKKAVFDIHFEISGDDITLSSSVGGTSTSVCTDPAPSSAPILLSAVPGINSVTLTWSPAVDPVSYYLVAYGTTSGIYQYGNPNVGGKGTTSYTVTNLSGGVPYYFVVRAGNGCTPGPFSNELSANPTGGFVAGIAEGFLPEVLGTEDEVSERQIPEVKGVSCSDKNYYWWLPLVIQLLLGIILIKRSIIFPIILGIVSQLIHQWLGCNCATNIWCTRYWILNLIIVTCVVLLNKFIQIKNRKNVIKSSA